MPPSARAPNQNVDAKMSMADANAKGQIKVDLAPEHIGSAIWIGLAGLLCMLFSGFSASLAFVVAVEAPVAFPWVLAGTAVVCLVAAIGLLRLHSIGRAAATIALLINFSLSSSFPGGVPARSLAVLILGLVFLFRPSTSAVLSAGYAVGRTPSRPWPFWLMMRIITLLAGLLLGAVIAPQVHR